MKILFVTRKFPPSTGGMELFAHDLSAALADKVDLRLIAWGGTGRIKAVFWAVPLLTVRSVAALLHERTDIIHVQDGVLAPVGWLLSKIFGRPYTVVIHGLDLTFKNPVFRAVVPWSVRRAAMVFCISQAAADEALRQRVAKERIRIIPLAVEDRFYGKSNRGELRKFLNLPEDSKILVTVGRLVKRKGVAWFTENVLPDLIQRYPNLVYVVVGDGSDRPNVEAAVARSGMQSYVKLLGRVPDEVAAAAYCGSDLFVMPNINVPNDVEGFGLVLLEASLAGRPVVAANTEGIKDAVTDGKNGILVPVEDVAAFSREICRFLDDPARATRFGAASRQFTLETYQWSPIADCYVEAYKQLLPTKG